MNGDSKLILALAVGLAMLILGVGVFTASNIGETNRATHNLCKLARVAEDVRIVEEKVWGDFEDRVKVSLRVKLPPGQSRGQTLDTLRQIRRLKRAYAKARAADARLANC